MIYVSAICLGGNLIKKSFSFFNGKREDYMPFWLYCFSFLHDLWILWHQMANKSSKNERKKYNIAKIENNLDYFHCKKNLFLFKFSPRNIADTYIKLKPLPKPFF